MRYLSFFLVVLLAASCSVEKKALKAFNQGKYQNAIDLYQKTLSRNPGKANYFIAESYRLSNRIKEAESFYANAKGIGINKDTLQFYYAQSLKANGKYSEAIAQLNNLAENAANDKLKRLANAQVSGLHELEVLKQNKSYYRVKNLEALNTASAEYSPVFLNNELYFTSNRGSGKIYEAEGKPFSNIYKVASRGANVDLNTLMPLPSSINTEGINDGCVTFSPDGKIMVFAKGNTGKKKGGEDVDLYIARFRNGEWTAAQAITGSVNTPGHWESTPSFSPDGRTLYFSSSRPGGQGGLDIYSARMDSRGRFSQVKNLGSEINTPGDEYFPHMAEDGKLYFASDGHAGFGMLDIFVVNRVNGRNAIQNLGEPVNSNADDFGIFLFKPDRGFFTSNRAEGKGDDDVFTFINEDPNLKIVNYYLEGIVYTPDKEGKLQLLPNTKVSLLDNKRESMTDYVTGNDGKFLFRVYGDEDYELFGELDGYLTKRQRYTTKGKTVDPATLKELVTNITLDTILVMDRIELNKIFVLENIYFDFDKSDITPQAATELNKLVDILKDNAAIKIEMGSHTDSVGTQDYNIQLSQRRAESTVRYLVNNGISQQRLTAKGYGETKPIARNTNPDGSDNPVGRARNRRTEFKIVEIGDVVRPVSEEAEFDEDKYFKGDGN
ncbi:MAG: OmpA family protein [Cyclobacteriaceae bacterium]|nr:OmpA family protein [Cyclobacteriaceae bacterium]